MEKKKKSIVVEKTVYVTKDGKEFDIESDAQFHEDILNDKKRICTNCGGKGYINERTESVWVNTSWIPSEGEYDDVIKHDICPKCEGKGYLQLMWH